LFILYYDVIPSRHLSSYSHRITFTLFIIFIVRLGTYKYPYLTGSFPSCSLLDFLSGKSRLYYLLFNINLLDFLSVSRVSVTSDEPTCSDKSPTPEPTVALTLTLVLVNLTCIFESATFTSDFQRTVSHPFTSVNNQGLTQNIDQSPSAKQHDALELINFWLEQLVASDVASYLKGYCGDFIAGVEQMSGSQLFSNTGE
jgi:hypothetical protein